MQADDEMSHPMWAMFAVGAVMGFIIGYLTALGW